MDGLDKIYQMQKQAAGSTKIPWYTKLKDWFKNRYSETGPLSVQGLYRVGKNGRKYTITAQADATKLKPGAIVNDASLAGLTATTGYLSLKGNGTDNDAPADGGKPSTDESKPATDGSKTTTDGGKTADDGGKTADDKLDLWDSAANWIKENPLLAGAGAVGLGGLGYYAFSDDDDEEEEEEE